MFNYLKSEWYRTFRQRRLWVLLGAISLLGALYYLLAFYAFNWQQPGIESVLGELGTLMPGVGFCLLLFVCEAAFSDEKWLGTFKNSVSFGISRERIYFGKLLNSLRLCLLTLAALVAVLIFGMGCLFLGVRNPERFREQTAAFWKMAAASLPLWLCGAAAANALFCVMRKSLDGIFSYLALFTGGNLIVSLLGRIYDLPKMFSYLPSELLNRLSAGLLFADGSLMGKCWVTGIVLTAVFSAAGFAAFRSMEVK